MQGHSRMLGSEMRTYEIFFLGSSHRTTHLDYTPQHAPEGWESRLHTPVAYYSQDDLCHTSVRLNPWCFEHYVSCFCSSDSMLMVLFVHHLRREFCTCIYLYLAYLTCLRVCVWEREILACLCNSEWGGGRGDHGKDVRNTLLVCLRGRYLLNQSVLTLAFPTIYSCP